MRMHVPNCKIVQSMSLKFVFVVVIGIERKLKLCLFKLSLMAARILKGLGEQEERELAKQKQNCYFC
jgi:hypothetical protein